MMLQSFAVTASPEQGPPRLARLRAALAEAGLDGFLVPRADAHQGEYVAPRDERLAWLTGFTGSAGLAAVLPHIAGVFVDGRYQVQVKHQVDTDAFTPVPSTEVKLGDWLAEHLPDGGTVGFDPWLHTREALDKLEDRLKETSIRLSPVENVVDRLWPDQPDPPMGALWPHPADLAGESHEAKRARLAETVRTAGQTAAVLTLPDSIAWLLNIRGADVAHNPVPHAFAILHADARVDLFIVEAKLDDAVRAHLGDAVTCRPPGSFPAALRHLKGPARVDRATAPVAVAHILAEAGVEIVWGGDPAILPKACKNATELAGADAAHRRDGVAMAQFLAWVDATAPEGALTEIDVAKKLEGFRHATGALRDISFETISAAGPHGAINHYRVTEETNRTVGPSELLLVDSGGQYADGTTDITRTVPIGEPDPATGTAFTRVLKGMIAISRLRWPKGLAGRDLDALARYPLWLAGQDYDHGTGHGVGSYLSVHEGPQRMSKTAEVPLEPGMILSNEPGYYREGAFGIRIENLVVVEEAPSLPEGDDRPMLAFRTLSYTPIDRRLIRAEMLTPEERAWLDAYHTEVEARVGPELEEPDRAWLAAACAPI